MSMGKFIDSIFPNEQVWIEMGGENFLVSPRSELENFWDCEAVKRFFHENKIKLATHFGLIWWAGYKRAVAGYPKTFQTFVTKQVSG